MEYPLCKICEPPRRHAKGQPHKFAALTAGAITEVHQQLKDTPGATIKPTHMIANPAVVQAVEARLEEIKAKNRERQRRYRERAKAKK